MSPKLRVVVETIDQGPDDHAANLDADLEMWRNHPTSGWTEITDLGLREDDAFELAARWFLPSMQTTRITPGEYAVAVKSAGEYGDLGGYTVYALGRAAWSSRCHRSRSATLTRVFTRPNSWTRSE